MVRVPVRINQKKRSGYQDYLSNVNRIRAESRTSLAEPAHLVPSAATYKMQTCGESRSSTRVPHCSESESSYRDNRSAPYHHSVTSESQLTTRSSLMYKERKTDPQSKSNSVIDPNQFVEELSDSEDWDEIAQLVSNPTLKRSLDSSSEQLRKRSLLDLSSDSPPSCNTPCKSQYLQHDRAATASCSSELHSTERRLQSPCLSVKEKSRFCIQYPSMQQGTYLSQPRPWRVDSRALASYQDSGWVRDDRFSWFWTYR
ncbi:hypothetical protein KIN20_030347 [Parelaphostrongylus tenuis]|uniref:Uncharacterized protein n=1 Tax=Parelaphostrongylus tenuis TaxID=148309 RepID=A0AAD5R3M0_PARTN|nr:hypothetical protein KIN20_030347 [Parelaphostrongylus tenuis]